MSYSLVPYIHDLAKLRAAIGSNEVRLLVLEDANAYNARICSKD